MSKYGNKVFIHIVHGKSSDINLVNSGLITESKDGNKVFNPTMHASLINLVNIDLIIENINGNKISNPIVHGDKINSAEIMVVYNKYIEERSQSITWSKKILQVKEAIYPVRKH